jgi:electron transport complex protein RnfC
LQGVFLDSSGDFDYHLIMLFRRYGTFSGGISLPDDKQATLNASIHPCPLPARLLLPVSFGPSVGAQVLVKTGQTVLAGQKVVQGSSSDADVFSPLGGRVAALTTAQVPTREGFVSVPAIELTALEGPWETREEAQEKGSFNWRQAEASVLRERLAQGSLSTHRLNVRSLSAWIAKALSHGCRTLIANAMENQPYVSCDHRMLAEQGKQVLQGLAILARAIGATEVLLAADQRRLADYRQLLAAVRHYRISAVALPHKYPIGADPILVKVLKNREMPPGGTTMQVGAAVVGPATCLAIYRWIVLGQRAVGRVITLGGERASIRGNFWVPFGTLCNDLLPEASDLIHGGPMVGLRCSPQSVVTPGTEAVLALEPAPIRLATACVRCGWCTDHCPARLNVAALNDASELGLTDRARRLGAVACIECGVCSYICPSCLPLSQRVKRLKRVLLRPHRHDEPTSEPRTEVSGPSPREPRTEVSGPSPREPRTEVSGPSPREPRTEVSGPSPSEPRTEVSGPSPSEPRTEVSGPSPSEPRTEVSGPSLSEPRTEVSGPSLSEPRTEVSGPRQPGPVADSTGSERSGS